MPISVAWPANAETDCPPGYYQASSGDCVPDPEKLPTERALPNATAICVDGTYSFSEHPYSGAHVTAMAACQALGVGGRSATSNPV